MGSSLIEKNETKKQPQSGEKVKDHQELKDGHHDHHLEKKRAGDGQSAAKVTWKVPHPKSGERQPGFNLDYDPPQTHPPVHN
ncbi:OLC1v1002148C1 [Oldenlandia corymbosa var. corymbosa]|uniref:OLC1v1002148C1 n=1 Tax=Oldenlandia corymbosa var. corymbosa TaxID=529605 RepID=A0AAV1D7M2_OLDCO|nr:OLC1v1002148C1 [Oldenlandia corymbosa var. corymbosa]